MDDTTLHDFARFLHKNPGAQVEWSKLVDDEIERREILLSEGGGVSHEYPAIIREDLEGLDEMKRWHCD
jgi:hypothetical protein